MNANAVLEGADVAKKIINECLEQAAKGYMRSITEGNETRKQYWIERWVHLAGELNEIDRVILRKKAAD